MQNQTIHMFKNFSIALSVFVFAALASGFSPITANAADLSKSYDYYDTYTASSNNSSSYDYYDTYTPSSSNNTSTSYDYYDTYTPVTSSYVAPSYDYYDTYTPATYSTPTYYTPTYTTSTYSYGTPTYYTPTYTAPAQPTCTVSVNKSNIEVGESVTVTWSSTNATWGNISNLGSNLPTSGSRAITIGNTTTFTGTFTGNGGNASCSATLYVQPKPAPTCVITGPDSVTAGQSVTVSWSSTNAQGGNISNLGSNLAASGSHTFVLNNTTTFTGTFTGQGGSTTCSKTIVITQLCPSGYTGSYPNCVPPPTYNNPSCTITINNYNNNNGYYQPNQAVTISWSSANASWGTINQGLGNVNLNGTRTVYPTQTTTYTGTFYGNNGQQVTCSATVYMNGYVPPLTPNTPFVTLSAVPYTGLELGPVGTVLYWAFIAFWCALAAYLIVVKKVQNQVYESLVATLFGSKVAHTAPAHSGHAHVSHTAHAVVAHEDKTDDFIIQQINRVRA